jgi:hypothetical protein
MQTEIQNQNAIRGGSVLLEVGPSLLTLVNLGVLRDVSVDQQGESSIIPFDNGEGLSKFRNARTFQLNANLYEINFENLAIINDGEIEVTTVPGNAVNGDDQLIPAESYELGQVFEINAYNADGTPPTVNSVIGTTDGAITGYSLVKLANGRYGIALDASGDATTNTQDLTVNTDYTPAAKKEITINDTGTRTKKWMRITNTDENGKQLVYIFTGTTNVAPLSIDLAGDNEDDVAALPISLEGRLVRIEDTQAV